MTSCNKAWWMFGLALALAVPTQALAIVRVTIRPVALASASASDTAATLPTSQTQFTAGSSFVVELWAQTTEPNGLSSVTVDLTYVNTVITAQSITPGALFNAAGLTTGTINNAAGLVDDIGGSHPAASPPCSDQVGLTNWVRVAVIGVQAAGNGTSLIQSADTASVILGTAICNAFGNVVAADIDFGQVTVTVADCFNNADCDDGLFCNGPETCVANVCQAGTPPVVSDGVVCTDDSCDEVNNVVVNTPNNANCDNGLFCDGAETCDAALDCQAGTPPVISDGVVCTDDSCDEVNNVVVNTPNNANCDNGLFCDGAETCDAVLDCQAGAPPVISDGVVCTDDSCDEVNNVVVNTPNNANCDNGLFCDGAETCDAVLDCQVGTPPVISDGVVCTDDSCDEVNNVVVNTPNNANCDNGLFCDGAETCDAALDCQVGTPVCTATCEHCDEAGATCALCVLDLDFNGVMGTGDFALFASCFGSCYLSTDPCAASNFDGDAGVCVGTGDFSGFAGCFGLDCTACGNCAGPPPLVANRSFSTEPVAAISLVAVRTPTAWDTVAVLPMSQRTFRVDQPFFVEVWATRSAAWMADGLAAVFVDLSFDNPELSAEYVVPSAAMSTFAGGVIQSGIGLVSELGGCANLDSMGLGAGGTWVRVGTLAVRGAAPGAVTLATSPSDLIHGVAIVNELGNVDVSRIDFGMVSVNVVSKPGIRDAARRLRGDGVR